MRASHTSGLLLAPLLFLLPAGYVARSSPLGIERQTELVDPRDAGWFYRPERIESEKPEELLDLLGIKEGDVVADIGAGAGFFSLGSEGLLALAQSRRLADYCSGSLSPGARTGRLRSSKSNGIHRAATRATNAIRSRTLTMQFL